MSPIKKLPNEILMKIFLELENPFALASVCQHWNRLIHADIFSKWKLQQIRSGIEDASIYERLRTRTKRRKIKLKYFRKIILYQNKRFNFFKLSEISISELHPLNPQRIEIMETAIQMEEASIFSRAVLNVTTTASWANLLRYRWTLFKLTTLKIESKNLEYLSRQIGFATQLEVLSVSKNILRTLPLEVFGLTKLRSLDLWSNKIRFLSPLISQLTNLTYLDLSLNELKLIPREIGNLTSLRGLDFSANNFRTFPVELLRLSNLEHLDLRNYYLRSFPPPFWSAENIAIKNAIKEITSNTMHFLL